MSAPARPIPLAAVLAGGRARRMGTDKARLPLAGRSLLDRVCDRVGRVARRVVVVGGSARPEDAGIPVVTDRYPGADAKGGIATALAYGAGVLGPRGWVAVVACDMPFVEPALLERLWAARGDARVVVPRGAAGYEPLCALYRCDMLPEFEAGIAAGDLRMRTAFPPGATREVAAASLRPVDPDLRSFLNVNRPADLERARRILEGAPQERPPGPGERPSRPAPGRSPTLR